jgi:hypothetical protein
LGNRSRQIDIIITSDSTLQFSSSLSSTWGKSFNCIEGCFAALSVKTKLNKTTLAESFDNISSIPLLKRITLNPLVANLEKFIKQVPLKIVFAFDGDSVENIRTALKEYQDSNTHPPENLPDLIIVNRKYYIWKTSADGVEDISNHIRYDYGSYIFEYNYEGVGAMALLHLMTHIQKITNLSMVSMINFDEYINGAEIYLKRSYINRDNI